MTTAADRGVADSLEAVLSENTRRTYDAQWRLFDDWCAEVGLTPLPAEPLTVARYLAARAGSGASVATLRLAASYGTVPGTGPIFCAGRHDAILRITTGLWAASAD